ncbi:MAG: glycoside hydrolase family 43 protein [Chloroflexota bacterium]|nr:glycoside hydrolase family 43 protein [Chloroflexota bacterium]
MGAKAESTATFRNPLMPEGPDPWMVCHEGYYYLTATSSDQIRMRKSSSLTHIPDAPDITVWTDRTPGRCTQIWAPECYLLDGPNGRRWYLYYTASDGNDLMHRLHVLEGTHDDPMGPYTYKAQLRTDARDEWYGIDAGVLQTGDERLYLLWAGHPGHVLFISAMTDPWTLAGERVHLPASGFGCDEVREGPVALRRNGKIFLVYSACDTGKPDYKLGMLIADERSDLLDPTSWRQHPRPVFERCDANGVYGPGHNGFFLSPDGTEDWIIYHAKSSAEYTYEGRNPRAQPFGWTPDGTPDFGVPLPLDAEIPVPSGDPGASSFAS